MGFIMVYIGETYGIYLENTMGYNEQKLWDILWDILATNWDMRGKNYWIYLSKTMGYIMKYIGLKLCIIMGKNNGRNWAKTFRDISQILWDIFCKNHGINWAKTMGNIGQILWVIFGKNNGIYWPKQWDILTKIMGYIMGYIGNNYGINWAKIMRYIW